MPIPPEPLTNPRKGAAGPAASSRSVPLGKAKGHTVTRGRSPGHAPPVLQLGPLSFWKLPHTHFPGLSGRKGAVCPLNLGVRFCFYAKIPVDSLCITGLAVAPTLHNPSCLLRSEGLRVLRASVAASWRGPRAPCEAPASCAQPSRPASVLPRATRPASPGPLSRLLLAQGVWSFIQWLSLPSPHPGLCLVDLPITAHTYVLQLRRIPGSRLVNKEVETPPPNQ